MSKKFKQLLVPEGYRHYWSKYPEGYTILEALLNWVDSANQLTDNVNDWNIYLDDFVENFDEKLAPTVREMLNEMEQDGRLADIINEEIFSSKADLDYVDDELDKKSTIVTEKITLRVPSEYDSIKTAIDEATKYTTQANVEVVILLETLYTIPNTVTLSNGDYSHITISSEDATVYLSVGFSGNIFNFINCSAPIINILVNAQGRCDNGICYFSNSQGRIWSNSGVTHAGNEGLYVRHASTVVANNTIFTHAAQNENQSAGITVWGGSSVSAYGADVSDSLYYGFRVAHGSIAEFDNGKANRCGRHGVRASQNASLAARYIEATDCANHGLYALDTSYINGTQSDVSRSGGRGICASGASMIEAFSSVINDCARGVYAERGSTINIYSSSILDTTGLQAIYASHSSTVEARNVIINGNQDVGIYVNESSKVNAQNADVRGSISHGVHATNVSDINISGSVIRNNGGNGVRVNNMSRVSVGYGQCWNNGDEDLYVSRGGMIEAQNLVTTAGTNPSGPNTQDPQIEDTNITSFNTLSSDGYITN